MLRIGIVGTDGGGMRGHSASICKKLSMGAYDAVVSEVFGHDRRETEEVCTLCGGARVAESMEELIEGSDAVMVLFRNGNFHAEYAAAALRAGKATFVDKPLSCRAEDAARIVEAARQSGAPLCSGSHLKYSSSLDDIKRAVEGKHNISSVYISFPLNDSPEYGGIHFYSHHIIEEYSAVFDRKIQTVTAKKIGGNIAVLADCGEFPILMNCGVWYGSTHFAVYFGDGANICRDIEPNGEDRQICDFISVAKGIALPRDYESQLEPVKISLAIEKSLESGLETAVEY